MKDIILRQPSEIFFGKDVFQKLPEHPLLKKGGSVLALVAGPLLSLVKPVLDKIPGLIIMIYEYPGEPTFEEFRNLQKKLGQDIPECFIGIGGGSVMDSAKLLAAFADGKQELEVSAGVGNLKYRSKSVICVPTTSGTGSEVSPIGILLNETTQVKTGFVSPHLVPDACFVDPVLTTGLPPRITAETGMDALAHCIEAFTNINAHPAVDTYAIKGIELVSGSLLNAVKDGSDIQARSAMSLASMYGGLCLGPVNTLAVHALSYGLGGSYHIGHGLGNAILLPEVLKFNLSANPERHAQVALALGAENKDSFEETALAGIEILKQLSIDCGIPQTLNEIGIKEEDLPVLADIAMQVTRLLNNNPRPVSREDAIQIYRNILA